ncbi:hypothetical protein K439DRAFT_1357684, partial [Ramaria rubella]
NYLRDLKGAKLNVVTQQHCLSFPDGLWTDILADRFIDLDKVHSGYHMLEPNYKHTQSISELDIVLNAGSGRGKATKTIRTHGEWSITHAIMEHATLFAYPHRANELSDYKDFIIGLFTSMDDMSCHYRVINLNKAIRMRVSKSNAFSLITFKTFNNLVSRHIISNNTMAPCTGQSKQS